MVCHSLSLFQEDSKVDVHGKQSFPNTVTADSRLLENCIWVGKIYLGTAHSDPDLRICPECGMLVASRTQPPGQVQGWSQKSREKS